MAASGCPTDAIEINEKEECNCEECDCPTDEECGCEHCHCSDENKENA